jgi:predicted Ser/Thr protein kinase
MDTKPTCPRCGRPLNASSPLGLCPECLMQGAFPTGSDAAAPTRFVPPSLDELAAKFPQLDILGFIGQGGMGAVYKARQKQLDRIVALKILPPRRDAGPAFGERFAREARALAQLNHPHIVVLYEFGQAEDLFYFLMEYVDGVDLRELLKAGRLEPKEAVAIVPQICEALQYAHERGIVHRDIKPQNILLNRQGQVKIADFGVAKLLGQGPEPAAPNSGEPAGELTEAGSTLGTPQYMAPEQLKNSAEVDHRADIYSLGVVFYQMLTGELPSGKIEPPSRKVQVDVRLDEVVLRALEKKPELRYQQAGTFGTEVETIAHTAPGISPARARVAAVRRFVVVAVILVALIGLAFISILFHARQPARTLPEPPQSVAEARTPLAVSEPSAKSDYIGQAYFARSNSLEITSVQRSAEQIIVRGHYQVPGENAVLLALSFAPTNGVPGQAEDGPAAFMMQMDGDFAVTNNHPAAGLPHLKLTTPWGSLCADLYFGTKAEAAAEARVRLVHPRVISVFPPKGATNVDLTQDLRIRFDQPMSPDTMQISARSDCFQFRGWPRYDADRNEFTFPVRFLAGQTDQISLADLIGTFRTTNFDSGEPYQWQFTTRPPPTNPGAPRPKVVHLSPNTDETWPMLTFLKVTFDQPMELSGVHRPDLWKRDWNPGGPYVHAYIDYDPATRCYSIPLVLPSNSEPKFVLDGFCSAAGVAADPILLHCKVGTNLISADQTSDEAAAARDPRLESLLAAMQTARAQVTSGIETVQQCNFSPQRIGYNVARFKWQGTNQFCGDVTTIMNTSSKAFLVGSDGKICWMYGDSSQHGPDLFCVPSTQVTRCYVSFADPFGLTHRTVKNVLVQDHLVYDGQTELNGRACHRVHQWAAWPEPGSVPRSSARRMEWWIDAQTFLPVQLMNGAPTDGTIWRFDYAQLNQPIPASAFRPPNPDAPKDPTDWFDKPLDPGEERYISVGDGSDGEMTAGMRRNGPNGRIGGGLN